MLERNYTKTDTTSVFREDFLIRKDAKKKWRQLRTLIAFKGLQVSSDFLIK